MRMPAGNGTGPMGLGPMTGRAAGYCAGYPVPGFMNPYGSRWLGSGYAPYGGPYAAGAPGAYPYYAPFPGRGLGLGWGRGGWGMGLGWRRGRGRGIGLGWGRGGWGMGMAWGRGRGLGRGRAWAW